MGASYRKLAAKGEAELHAGRTRSRTPSLPLEVTLSPRAEATWAKALDRLRDELPPATFALWIEPHRLAGEHDSVLWLTAPRHVWPWTKRRYGKTIGEVVRDLSELRGVLVAEAPARAPEGAL